jgi:hypothetical protein
MPEFLMKGGEMSIVVGVETRKLGKGGKSRRGTQQKKPSPVRAFLNEFDLIKSLN